MRDTTHLLSVRPGPAATVGMTGTLGATPSTFAARFRDLLGQPPIRYLTAVRLSRAAGYLATTDHNLAAIARRSGYDSEASLSKAVKRTYGRSPGDYRRRSVRQPIVVDGDAPGPRQPVPAPAPDG